MDVEGISEDWELSSGEVEGEVEGEVGCSRGCFFFAMFKKVDFSFVFLVISIVDVLNRK